MAKKFFSANLTADGQAVLGEVDGKFAIQIEGTFGSGTVEVQGKIGGSNYDLIAGKTYTGDVADTFSFAGEVQFDLSGATTPNINIYARKIKEE